MLGPRFRILDMKISPREDMVRRIRISGQNANVQHPEAKAYENVKF